MSKFWQAPGRSELFNTYLSDWKVDLEKDTSKKTIAVLKFINDNPDIRVSDFNKFFLNFLEDFKKNLNLNEEISFKEGEKANSHLFKVLLFIGFIQVTNQDKLTKTKSADKLNMTDEGKLFFKEFKNENFDDALNILLERLFKTKYPNKATYKVKLESYPFLLMFKLLSENNPHHGVIPRKMFITDVPFIKNKIDLDNCLEKLNDECYLNYLDELKINSLLDYGYKENHKKWNMWVISSLIDLGILEEHGGYIILSNYKKQFIQDFVDKITYEECFQHDKNL